ncbi:MAG TPA: GntP family permease [Methanoregulaceae archaeon]|nr:GntP family permease [Methanoregulaceae archaeon]
MDPLLAFVITLALITVLGLKYRIAPFFTLIGGALLFGILTGLDPDTIILAITAGLGRIFGIFGIVILSGAVIARLLAKQNQIEIIVSDIRRFTRNPPVLAGASGYILAVPVTCCITAFVMLAPLASHFRKDEGARKNLIYITALGTLFSFAFLYPTPVTLPLVSLFSSGISPLYYDALAIPVSLLLLAGVILFYRFFYQENGQDAGYDEPDGIDSGEGSHVRAWLPVLTILLAIPAGFLVGLSHAALIQFIMLAGAACAIILAPQGVRLEGLSQGAKHAGVIIFDICGAGALGYVIVQGGFAAGVLSGVEGVIPALCIPFIVAALIQTAQGSRVVTAVLTGEIISGTALSTILHPLTLILMIAAGTCVISYITDPYFWLIQRTTGDGIGVVVRKYTFPLAMAGLAVFLIAAGMQIFLF